MRRAAPILLALLMGCATPLEVGEQHYREGDRRGALETWRSVREDHRQHEAIAARIAAVEEELERLTVGYKESARRGEEEGRLAESILDYRLALELQPDDVATMAHVQRLARELAARKATEREEYDRLLAEGDLDAAQSALAGLRTLDPFDPEYETEERQLQAALRAEYRRRQAEARRRQAGEVEALVESGRAAFRDEQLQTALDLWRRALLMDPENERLMAYIARAERQLANLERLRADPAAGGGR